MRRMHIALKLLGILALLIVPVQENTLAQDRATELAAIEQTLNHYLEGGRSGDIDRLRQAFHPSARVQFVRNGMYGEWSLEQYLGGRPRGKPSDHSARLLHIDFAGNAATAKLKLDFGGFSLVDYMALLKIDGRWWIVNKIFYREER